ncbi:hypothetical protein KOR42_53540 [Thalassoglobus neptunius]|uniref:Uncharacterized protein n=1 Tax=Thalassoglobus neptunius TaxID=1938619 RepID=A0A5C5VBI5_9PLAN|nr:hypothetical protein KOR42_53540 [Thalassoglobus neptunius]
MDWQPLLTSIDVAGCTFMFDVSCFGRIDRSRLAFGLSSIGLSILGRFDLTQIAFGDIVRRHLRICWFQLFVIAWNVCGRWQTQVDGAWGWVNWGFAGVGFMGLVC